MTIIEKISQHRNTYFQWGSAYWSGVKRRFCRGHVWCRFGGMMTMWPHSILIRFKIWHSISPDLLVCVLWLWSLSFSVNYHAMLTRKNAYFSDIQHSHPNITLWHADIFFSQGGIICICICICIYVYIFLYISIFNGYQRFYFTPFT